MGDDLRPTLFESYTVADGRDEVVGDDGRVRDHWERVVSALDSIGSEELGRRHEELRLLLAQDGVTYDVGPDAARPRGRWSVDPVPFVVPADEWRTIERGVVQRCEVLDLVLRDLYGPRRLLRSGVVPPEMMFADPQFSRACDGVELPGPKQLVVAAVDLVRGRDGRWIVLGNRTQAPSGIAYALENRRVVARVLPQVVRGAAVRPLAPFVAALRAALVAAAPAGAEDPSIVVLSPGPLSETAFEHAALAAVLGAPLVQGADLEVRQGRLGMRSVGDWLPVDVVLRRVDAGFCDPLELRADSTLGVPGLLDACRTGSVSVVNSLGSGVLENAGLLGLVGELTRHLLDEDPVLEPVPTWWCGDTAGRSHVLAGLGELIVRPLSRLYLEHAIDTSQSSTAELDELRRRIIARPDQWVGQQRAVPTCTPVLEAGRLEPRPAVLRAFAAAGGGSYVVMAGGLARTAAADRPMAPIANPAGATSKDTWVMHGDAAWVTTDAWADHEPQLRTPVEALPPRAAEHLYWMGRYAERSESTLRLVRTVAARRGELDATSSGPGAAALGVLLDAVAMVSGVATDPAASPGERLFAVAVDERRPGTVAHAVRHLLDALDVVRDRMSVDAWLVVGAAQRQLDQLGQSGVAGGRNRLGAVLDDALQRLLALAGLLEGSMVRDHGWQLLDAGRRVERAAGVIGLVASTLTVELDPAVEPVVLDSVLGAADSLVPSRRRRRSRAQLSALLELLLVDPTNPRSVRFQVDRLAEVVATLRREWPAGAVPTAEPIVEQLLALVTTMDPARSAAVVVDGRRVELEQLLGELRGLLWQASDAIASDSFRHLAAQRSVVVPRTSPRGPSGRVDVDVDPTGGSAA